MADWNIGEDPVFANPACHSYDTTCPGTVIFTSAAYNCGAPYCSNITCGPVEAERTAMAQDREYQQFVANDDGSLCSQWRKVPRKLTGCSCLDLPE